MPYAQFRIFLLKGRKEERKEVRKEERKEGRKEEREGGRKKEKKRKKGRKAIYS